MPDNLIPGWAQLPAHTACSGRHKAGRVRHHRLRTCNHKRTRMMTKRQKGRKPPSCIFLAYAMPRLSATDYEVLARFTINWSRASPLSSGRTGACSKRPGRAAILAACGLVGATGRSPLLLEPCHRPARRRGAGGRRVMQYASHVKEERDPRHRSVLCSSVPSLFRYSPPEDQEQRRLRGVS